MNFQKPRHFINPSRTFNQRMWQRSVSNPDTAILQNKRKNTTEHKGKLKMYKMCKIQLSININYLINTINWKAGKNDVANTILNLLEFIRYDRCSYESKYVLGSKFVLKNKYRKIFKLFVVLFYNSKCCVFKQGPMIMALTKINVLWDCCVTTLDRALSLRQKTLCL